MDEFQSQGQSAQGTHISIETSEPVGIPITAIAKGATTTITFANTLKPGDVVKIGPNTDIPALSGKVAPVISATLAEAVLAIDSTNMAGAWVAGGTVVVPVMATGCEVTSFNGFDGQSSELDITTLCSTAKEYLTGLQDFGNMQMDLNLVPGEDFQVAAIAAKEAVPAVAKAFKLLLPDGLNMWIFRGFVRSFPIKGGVDQPLTGSMTVRITGKPVFMALPAP